MRLSSLADYAIVLMSAAARRSDGVGGATARLTATALAEETRVPLPTAQKLVSRLAAAGLIESARGTGGGFRLARPAAAISLADIVEAVEGPIALTTCVDEDRHDCALDHCCAVKPHWGVVNAAVRGALAGVSLVDISRLPGEGRGPVAMTSVTARSISSSTPPTWGSAFAGEERVGVER